MTIFIIFCRYIHKRKQGKQDTNKTRTKHKTDNAQLISVQRTESGFLIRQSSWRRPRVGQRRLSAARAAKRQIPLNDDKLLAGHVAKRTPSLSHKFDWLPRAVTHCFYSSAVTWSTLSLPLELRTSHIRQHALWFTPGRRMRAGELVSAGHSSPSVTHTHYGRKLNCEL